MSRDLHQLVQRLGRHEKPTRNYGPVQKRAAVAMVLLQGANDVEVLMIQRARREGDPWSGHMGFPGGRRDRDDRDNLSCAMRETWEEVGLDLAAQGELVAELGDINTGWRPDRPEMLVSPFVFTLSQRPSLTLNYEVDDTVWVPLAFLRDQGNRHDHHWEWRGEKLTTDAYRYREKRIWGLSLMMLDELIEAIAR